MKNNKDYTADAVSREHMFEHLSSVTRCMYGELAANDPLYDGPSHAYVQDLVDQNAESSLRVGR